MNDRSCCCCCSTRGRRPGRTPTPAGMEAAVAAGRVTRPGRRGGLLPGQAARRRPGRRPRSPPRHAGSFRAERPAARVRAPSWPVLDAEFDARIAVRGDPRGVAGSSGGGLRRLLRSVLPDGGPGDGVRAVRGTGAASPARARGRRAPLAGGDAGAGRAGRGAGARAPGRRARRCGCSGSTRSPCRRCWPGWPPRSTRGRAARPATGRPTARPALDLLADCHLHRGGASLCVLTCCADAPHHDARHGHDAAAAARPARRVPRIGIGGPVGSGKTALVAALCRALAGELTIGVVTNDIYTTEDADFLRRAGVLPDERIRAVQTGACPHTAIRDDISANLDAVEAARGRAPRTSTWSWSRAAATT